MSSNPQSESEGPLLGKILAPPSGVCQRLHWCVAAPFAVGLVALGFLYFNLAPAPRAPLTSLAPALQNHSLHSLARAAQSLGDNASWHEEFFDFKISMWHMRVGKLGEKFPWSFCAEGLPSGRLCHDGLTGAWRFRDDNESYTFFFVGGRLINETEDVPEGCREIHRRDEVAQLDAGCEAFCSAVFGPPSPWSLPMQRQMLASSNNFPDFVRVSAHACGMLWPALLLEPLRSKAVQWSLVALYAIAGLLGFLFCLRGTTEEEHGYQWEQETSPKVDLTKLDLPLCCVTAGTHKNRAWWQMATAIPFALLDNPLDVLALTNFAIKGRIFFFIATASGLALTGCADPFQARAYAAAWSSWRRGFPGRKWLEHQAHEGGHEAPIAGFIALASLAAAPVGAVDLQSLAINTASGLSSLAMAVPNGAKARHLLTKIDNGQTDIENDYVRQEEAKKGVPTGVKFGFSAQLLSAVAMVGLFPRLSGGGAGYTFGAGIVLFHLLEDALRMPCTQPWPLVAMIKVMPPLYTALFTALGPFAAMALWIQEPKRPTGYIEELWSTCLSGWQTEAAAAVVQLSLLLFGALAVFPALVWSVLDCWESFQAWRREKGPRIAQATSA